MDLCVLSIGAFNHESLSPSKALNIYVHLAGFIYFLTAQREDESSSMEHMQREINN